MILQLANIQEFIKTIVIIIFLFLIFKENAYNVSLLRMLVFSVVLIIKLCQFKKILFSILCAFGICSRFSYWAPFFRPESNPVAWFHC